MKKHVNELQMQKYFLGMLLGTKASLSANNLEIKQKLFLPTLCTLCTMGELKSYSSVRPSKFFTIVHFEHKESLEFDKAINFFYRSINYLEGTFAY